MKELSLVAMVVLVGMATAAVAQDHQMIDPTAERMQNETKDMRAPSTKPEVGESHPLRISAVVQG